MAIAKQQERDGEELPVETDGKLVKVSAATAEDAFLVLGWSPQELAAKGDGSLQVEIGSASVPVDSDITVYRLVPVARWPGGGNPIVDFIRCRNFADCPVPPPPGPIPPRPFQVQLIVRGR